MTPPGNPPSGSIVHQLGAQIPWKHNCVLLDRVKDPEARTFYIQKTVEHGWSRSVLVHQIDTKLHRRLGKAPTNFALTMPPVQSDLAQELLKDPYIFKPAPLDESANEHALENALLARLKDFLIELGSGFAFIGNQYRLLPAALKSQLPDASKLRKVVSQAVLKK